MDNEREGGQRRMSKGDRARNLFVCSVLAYSDYLQFLDGNKYKGGIYMVFEYMDHDLTGLADRPGMRFSVPQIKCYMRQLLTGLHYCHVNQVLHRDIKGSNLLIDNEGNLKLADFGLARSFSNDHNANLTNRVITLWYRPPELLLGATKYGPAVDMWSVGCIFAELLHGKPIFPGKDEVEDATKALEATNGTPLEREVAYAKSILGPGSGMSGSSQSSSPAAAAIEAATFAQQYDAVGWAPKEYNPDDKQFTGGKEQSGGDLVQSDGVAPQSGFVWDEASGYYYDASSGFYYDGNTGLYYDGNNGIWYSYDHQNLQYIPCTDQNGTKGSANQSQLSKTSDDSSVKKLVISAPATTSAASLPDAVQAAATAAIAAERKEKEKSKEIKLASKSSILANKKKMNNVLTMWKQRSHEGQVTRVALDDNQQSAPANDRHVSSVPSAKTKSKIDVPTKNENTISSSGVTTTVSTADTLGLESSVMPRPVSNSIGGTLMGVIRGSGRTVVKSDTSFPASSGVSTPSSSAAGIAGSSAPTEADISTVLTPFRTDASVLGSYTPPVAAGSGRRRFSEMPASAHKEPHTGYRDRAAERRNLYGSSSSFGDDLPEHGFGESNRDLTLRKGSFDSMPFPPGVGGGRVTGDATIDSYEVITSEKAIDESNVGNKMLRSMGWHEGLGLGRDGSGMVEPVQAQSVERRAGLGSQQKKLDPALEAQAGDSYKTIIHKKALARFREMS